MGGRRRGQIEKFVAAVEQNYNCNNVYHNYHHAVSNACYENVTSAAPGVTKT